MPANQVCSPELSLPVSCHRWPRLTPKTARFLFIKVSGLNIGPKPNLSSRNGFGNWEFVAVETPNMPKRPVWRNAKTLFPVRPAERINDELDPTTLGQARQVLCPIPVHVIECLVEPTRLQECVLAGASRAVNPGADVPRDVDCCQT